MTLNTTDGGGATRYWVNNLLTGETIWLEPAAGGLWPDAGQLQRYGQSEGWVDPTGIAPWRLGTRSTFCVLSSADISAIYSAVNTFGSTGALATPVTTALVGEVTVVKQDNRVCNAPPPFSNGQPVAQLAIVQGLNVVLLSQQNCVDLAPQLSIIAAT